MRVLCEASFCASTKNGLNKSVHKFKTKFKIKTPATKNIKRIKYDYDEYERLGYKSSGLYFTWKWLPERAKMPHICAT